MGTDFETLSGTFTFVAGQTTGSISIPILDDSNIEMSETFRIELVAQGGAEFSNSLSSIRNISVTILDNESPTLSITGGPMVTESDVSGSPAYARFTISTPIEPTTTNFAVQYTPTSSNFVANSGSPTTSRVLDFSDPDNDGIYTAELRVEIVSDKDKEVNENLEVTLNPDTVGMENYFVGSPATASVFVIDDDATIPELSLESLSTPIGESAGEVVFTVLASEAPGRELTVYYTPAEVGGGDFITNAVASESSTGVTFQTIGGQEKGSITVKLDNDTRTEPTGMIELTLNADSAPAQTYTVVAGDASSTTVTILDNDAPTLSITGGSMVTESDVSGSPAHAIFTISSQVEPVTNNFTVQYTPTSSAFVANSGTRMTSHTLDFSDPDNDGIYTAELRVEIVSDDVEELNGNLEVSLNADTVGSEKYFVDSSANSATVFVVDDDAVIPELSFESMTTPIAESARNVVLTVIASEAPGREVTVHYTPAEVGDGNFLTDAVASESSAGVTFQTIGGQEKGSITVDLDNDSVAEATGMIKVALNADSAPAQTYTVIAGDASSVTVTIWDDDAPELTITGGNKVTESDTVGSPAQAIFTVHSPVLPNDGLPNSGSLVVNFTSVSPTFVADTLDNRTRTLNFVHNTTDGNYQASLPIDIVSDSDAEVDDKVTVTLSNDSAPISYYVGTPNQAEVAVADDDSGFPLLTIEDLTTPVFEDNVVEFTITANENPKRPLSIRYIPDDVDGDFILNSNEQATNSPALTFEPVNDGSGHYMTTLSFNPNDDSITEVRGQISITLAAETDQVAFPTYQVDTSSDDNSASAIIWDNDAPELSIIAGDDIVEGPGVEAEFKVIANFLPSGSTLDVRYTPRNQQFLATSVHDDETSRPLNFSEVNNVVSAPLGIAIESDNEVDLDGTIEVTLVADNNSPLTYSVAPSPANRASVNIRDDDLPNLSIGDESSLEGDNSINGMVEFSPMLDVAAGRDITITYTTTSIGDFPVDADDYSAETDATVTILAGETAPQNPIRISTTADNFAEPDETFVLTYSADHATVADDTAIGTIKNDDERVLAVNSITINEDSGTADLDISLFPPVEAGDTAIDVTYATSNGAAIGSTTPNTGDFEETSGSVSFEAGEPSKSISVNITNDNLKEDNESFTVTVATLVTEITRFQNGIGTVTIRDNDTIPVLHLIALPGNIIEGTIPENIPEGTTPTHTSQNIAVNLNTTTGQSEIAGREITVNYRLAGVDADVPQDVVLATTAPGRTSDTAGVLTIAKDSAPSAIPVVITSDNYDEVNETFTIMLSSPSGATIGTASITGRIEDDDDPPKVSIAKTVTEAETDADFTGTIAVSLDRASSKIVTVPYTVAVGTATADDFTLADTEIVFRPDPTTKITPKSMDITYTIKGDDLNEDSEQFTITLGTPTNGDITGANIIGTITITDDDTLPTLTIDDNFGNEGSLSSNGSIEFTPTLSTVSGRDIIVTYSTAPGGDFPVETDDYSSETDAKITIPAGRTTPVNPISITITADEEPEPDESFILTYSAEFVTVPIEPTAMGKIKNDDGQVLAITSAEVNENVGTASLKITLSPAPGTGETVRVNYQTLDGTAEGSADGSNADYTIISSTSDLFSVDEKSKLIQIDITDDTFNELQEKFTVSISTITPEVSIYANGVGTILINDNDSTLPALGFVALTGSTSEGTSAGNNTIQDITVNLGTGIIAKREITANYTLSSDNANIPADVKLAANAPGRISDTAGIITFAKNESSVVIPVEIIADEYDENNETFTITLSTPSGATIGTASIMGTIADDDDAPIVSIVERISETETDADFSSNIVISLDNESGKTVTVPFTVATGSASTADFTLVNSEVVFTPDPTTKLTPKTQNITFTIKGDDLNEDTEQFTITLGTPTNGDITGAIVTGTISIVDDDPDLPTLTIADAEGSEGKEESTSSNGAVKFVPTLSTISGRNIVVTYSTTPGGEFSVETGDYISVTDATITIPAGRTTPLNPISITTIADNVPEPDESFILTYSADLATVPAQPTATGIINNDDEQVLIITSTEVNEGTGTADLKVVLSPAPDTGETVSVSYQTMDGTATGSVDGTNADYTTISSTTIEFSEDEKSKPIQVDITDDSLNELQEMFTVVVSTTSTDITTHANGVGTVTINDNDSTQLALGFVELSGNISEGTNASTNTTHNITVNLGTGVIAGREITAGYTLSSDNAEIPMDVKLASSAPGRTSDTAGTITIAKGASTVNIPVEIIADEFDEDNESFTITLTSPTGATIGTESITGTIADDDDPPTVSIATTASETETDADFTGTIAVSLDRASTKTITVPYTVAPDSATAADFSLADSEVVFTPNPTTKITPKTLNITYTIKGDELNEDSEQFMITLGTPTNGDITGANITGTVTIADDDTDFPTLTIADEHGDEGSLSNGTIEFTPTLSTASGRDVIVTYSTAPSGDFPIETGDYSGIIDATITIPAGRTTPVNPISITTTADEDPEPDETFTLTYRADYADVPEQPTAIGTINNDDGQVLTITSAEVNENVGMVNLKMTLSPAPSTDESVLVSYQTVDGTAIGSINGSNADYTSVTTTTVEFGEDEKSKPIQISIEDDTFHELQEAFTVVVSTTESNITMHADGVGTVTINDNDNTPPALDFLALSGKIIEGTDANTNTIHNITVNLGTGLIAGREITADYTLSSENADIPHDIKLAATAPGRRSDTSGIITFTQGVGSVDIPVEIIADEFDEVDESFKISLANAINATIGTESITGIIGDDDDPPNIKISVEPVIEGNDPTTNAEMEFTVTLDKQSYKDIQVSYRTTSTGTATPDVDYSPIALDSEGELLTLTFTKRSISSSGIVTEGMTRQTFTIPIYGDTLDENDETVYVLLSDPQNATLPPNEVVEIGTITDDDALPELTVSPGKWKGGNDYSRSD